MSLDTQNTKNYHQSINLTRVVLHPRRSFLRPRATFSWRWRLVALILLDLLDLLDLLLLRPRHANAAVTPHVQELDQLRYALHSIAARQ